MGLRRRKRKFQKLPLIMTTVVFAFSTIANIYEFKNYPLAALFGVITVVSIATIRKYKDIPARVTLIFNLLLSFSFLLSAWEYYEKGSEEIPYIYLVLSVVYILIGIMLYRKQNAEEEKLTLKNSKEPL